MALVEVSHFTISSHFRYLILCPCDEWSNRAAFQELSKRTWLLDHGCGHENSRLPSSTLISESSSIALAHSYMTYIVPPSRQDPDTYNGGLYRYLLKLYGSSGFCPQEFLVDGECTVVFWPIDRVGAVQRFRPWDSWTLPMGVLTVSIWIQEMW